MASDEERPIRFFGTCLRQGNADAYWRGVLETADLCERYGFEGLLIYTGNDTPVDPWATAFTLLDRCASLAPLVAVNPIYAHPFTVARFVASVARVWGRRTYLNLVAGAALSDLEALDDDVSHGERYVRLREFGEVVKRLCAERVPLSFDGEFYGASNLVLPDGVPKGLQPGFFLAGQSDAAQAVTRALGACGMGMLQPGLSVHPSSARAAHFGVIVRPTDAEAWQSARGRFGPLPELRRRMFDTALENTDASWKARLARLGASDPDAGPECYWLGPFLHLLADCPYVVASTRRLSEVFATLAASGVEAFVLELGSEEDYRGVRDAVRAGLGH